MGPLGRGAYVREAKVQIQSIRGKWDLFRSLICFH